MTQPAFDFHAEPVRLQTPQETRQAGLRRATLTQGTVWARMLEIYAQGPLTDAEMAAELGLDRTTVTGRRDELMKMGKVTTTGETRRNTRSGVSNILWRLA